MYRKDLPLYELPLEPKKGTKHKLTGTTHPDQPKTKKGILTNKKAPPKVVSKPGQPNAKKHNIAKPTASSKRKLTEKALMIGNHMLPLHPPKTQVQ